MHTLPRAYSTSRLKSSRDASRRVNNIQVNDNSASNSAVQRRSLSLGTHAQLGKQSCLHTSCIVPVPGDSGRLPKLLDSIDNHVKPHRLESLVDADPRLPTLKAIVQPTRVVTKVVDASSSTPSLSAALHQQKAKQSYFPSPLSLPSVDFTLGNCLLAQETAKLSAHRDEAACETVDLGAPKSSPIGRQIARHNISLSSSYVVRETMQTNEYSIAQMVQGNVAAIRRTDNTLIKRIQDQLAANRKSLEECKARINSMDACALSLDAMMERVENLTHNSMLRELCNLSRDQEDIDRVICHINTQLDKEVKSFEETYTLGLEFAQRVIPYSNQLSVLEKSMTVLALKCEAIQNKLREQKH